MPVLETYQQDSSDHYIQADVHALQNENLSWKAKGLLCYLLSRPPDWQVQKSDLLKRATDGAHRLRKATQELEEQGYLRRVQPRSNDGTWTASAWYVTENPDELPLEPG